MPRRFNCCGFNHPTPIFCPFINFQCSNDVINPTTANDFGYFNNLAVGAIATGGTLPLSVVLFSGEGIISNGIGSVVLTPGNYEINYFAGGTVPADGTLGIGLQLNGTTVLGSVVTQSQDAGSTVNLTRTIALTVPSGGTVSLINTSAQTTTFSFASLFVRRL